MRTKSLEIPNILSMFLWQLIAKQSIKSAFRSKFSDISVGMVAASVESRGGFEKRGNIERSVTEMREKRDQ